MMMHLTMHLPTVNMHLPKVTMHLLKLTITYQKLLCTYQNLLYTIWKLICTYQKSLCTHWKLTMNLKIVTMLILKVTIHQLKVTMNLPKVTMCLVPIIIDHLFWWDAKIKLFNGKLISFKCFNCLLQLELTRWERNSYLTWNIPQNMSKRAKFQWPYSCFNNKEGEYEWFDRIKHWIWVHIFLSRYFSQKCQIVFISAKVQKYMTIILFHLSQYPDTAFIPKFELT